MKRRTFNVLECFEKLKSAGVPEELAKIQANALREVINERLVTKDFLDLRLKELEYKLTILLGGVVVASTALLLAALPIILN